MITVLSNIELTPNDHPSRAIYLNNSALTTHFARTDLMEDFDRAVFMKEQATSVVTAPPSIRTSGANPALQLLIRRDPYRAKPLLRAAIELLPKISPHTLKQKYYKSLALHLEQYQFHSNMRNPYNTLQLLKIEREVLVILQLEVRSDISGLRVSHSDLARQFDELHDQLDRPHSAVTELTQP